MEKQHRTIIGLVIGLIVFSFLGFYKSYFQFFPSFENTAWAVHFHVLTILCWFGMLVVQATLAVKGRIEQHRKFGRISYLLVPLIVLGFVLVTNYGQLRQKSPELLGATLFDGLLFLLFYGLAILNRNKTAYHASYMMLSAVPFINPGLGRFIAPEVGLTVEFLLLLGLFLVAFFKKRTYQPYLVGLGCFFAMLGMVVYFSFINPAILEGMWDAIWG